MATCTSPSVPFLNPTGIDRPDANCRRTWLSVVRAPPEAAPGARVGDVVGSNGAEPLAADRQPELENVEQEPASGSQPPVDVMRPVQARIVDETLPARDGPRFLEVHPHDDDQVPG